MKTQGGKLPVDFDPHLDRTHMPVSFSKSPKFLKQERSISADTNYTVNYGKQADIVTAAANSPITFSAAFKSKAPVGLVVKIPTSGIDHPIFQGTQEAIEISYPNKSSPSFLNPRGSVFGNIKPTPGLHEGMKSFSEKNTKGPTFPKGASGAANFQREKTSKQIKTMYPRLGKKLFPPAPKVEKNDPFAYLKPKIK